MLARGAQGRGDVRAAQVGLQGSCVGPRLDGAIYFNSPLDYLPGLTDEGTLQDIRRLRMVICCGQGAWEDEMLWETRALESVLRGKSIGAFVDYWGTDVSHDWPWWRRQMSHFLPQWLSA